jgi:hypothetical protein
MIASKIIVNGNRPYPVSDLSAQTLRLEHSTHPFPIQDKPYKPILDVAEGTRLTQVQILRNFADLFLECDSWGFLSGALAETSEKPGGVDWRSAQANWNLSRSALLKEWYDPDQVIGKRFGYWTNYFMLDIDRHSAYHPIQDGWVAIAGIRQVLAEMGLTHSLIVTSSHSQGLHLYFPLPRPVLSDLNARRVRDHIDQAGYGIKAGQLEIFPNVRSDQTVQFNGHKLPLQTGSFHLHQGKWQRDIGEFIESWHAAEDKQDIDLFIGRKASSTTTTGSNPATSSKRFNLADRMKWTGSGQSNLNLGAIVAYCVEQEGLRDPDEIEDRGWDLAYAAGYDTYSSEPEKKDKDHMRRWIKSKLRKLGGWTGNKAGNTKPNQHRSLNSTQRLLQIIEKPNQNQFSSMNQFCDFVTQESKRLFGVGFSKNTILERKESWIHLIQNNQSLLKPV